MGKYDLEILKPEFIQNWQGCALDADKREKVLSICRMIAKGKPLYQVVEAKTGVPWPLIGCIHQKECSLDWGENLANGDPWHKPTVNVPKGRGPFNSWQDAAVDALIGPHRYGKQHLIDEVKTWDIPSMLWFSERYNGMGYRGTKELSAYVWAFTNRHDETGKFVRDHVFDENAVQKNPGVASLLLGLIELGEIIDADFVRLPSGPTPIESPQETPKETPPSTPQPPTQPTEKKRISFFAWIKKIITGA